MVPAEGIASTSPAEVPGTLPRTINLTGVQWHEAVPAAAVAGVVGALLMLVPLGVLGLGPLVAGALSAILYHRRIPFAMITKGIGARLGILGGLFSFLIFTTFAAITALILRSRGELQDAFKEALQQSVHGTDPQTQQLLEYVNTPQGFVTILILGLVCILAFSVIASLVGGILGAAWLRRKQR